MSQTVDRLQQLLREEVFHYAQDGKKAAGRALGTIIEIITYYKICSWGFGGNLVIERPVREFGRADIEHNVEFSLHRQIGAEVRAIPTSVNSLTATRVAKMIGIAPTRNSNLLDGTRLQRNSALIREDEAALVVANLTGESNGHHNVSFSMLQPAPRAIFECKRVGVEEGMKKGPQSIEKAKQGAYVARSVSSLQKVFNPDGGVMGYLPGSAGDPTIRPYALFLDDILTRKTPLPRGFVLTVGVTSNHGNWFTDSNMNKEMKVLAAAYDWLLFLTDEGLMSFAEQCLINPQPECEVIKKAFRDSYTGEKGGNRFTKTRIDQAADRALRVFFERHAQESDGWFNIIAPGGENIAKLSSQLHALLRI